MKIPRLASRYAKAVLELAHEKGVVEEVKTDMKYLLQIISQNPELRIMLKSPIIKSDQKKKVMIEIGKNLNQITASLIKLLIHHRRESNIEDIAATYLEQYRIFKGIHLVRVTSARPLTNSLRETLIKKIKSNIGGSIELEEIVSPEIIGGLVLRINDREYNSSIKNQLNEFKKTFASNLYKPSF